MLRQRGLANLARAKQRHDRIVLNPAGEQVQVFCAFNHGPILIAKIRNVIPIFHATLRIGLSALSQRRNCLPPRLFRA